MMDVTEKISFIKTFDPDGAARLERLLGKEETLTTTGNIYRERFTGRQFSLVFDPLLDAVFEEHVAGGQDAPHRFNGGGAEVDVQRPAEAKLL